MKSQEIAKILYELATYLRMDDIAFKPQAYEKAAAALESFSQDVRELYQKEGIQGVEKIPGVGKGIAARIEEYVNTGTIVDYEAYKKNMPVNLEELSLVQGMGPKMMRDLWKHLKVKDLKDLKIAATLGKIRTLSGFGAKTEQNILQSIEFLKKSQGRWLLGTIYPYVQDLTALLKESGLAKEVVAAGSFRRMKETIGDVDILVTAKRQEEVIAYFLENVEYSKIWGKGSTKVSVHMKQGFNVDLRVVNEDVFGAALQYFTGSKEHNVKLRTYAIQKGFKISEYGVFKGKQRIACKNEQNVYSALGLPYIEPELREDQGEIEAALGRAPFAQGLPTLIPYSSLKGDLQIQTDWTDGEHSIEEMAKAAQKQGLEYIVITDHTKDLAMTAGSDEKKLVRQMAEIDRVNSKSEFRNSKFKILTGAEVNIRKDGTLDISDDVLAKLDVVGASVHSSFKMTKKDMTQRIIRAMENPNVDILFHPTGRFMPKRDAYEIDIDKVIQAAQKTGTVLEINGQPSRLDLQDIHIHRAIQGGAKLSIDSDSHHKDHLGFLRFGIAQARRGWAQKKDIVNTLSLGEFLRCLKRKE